MVAQKATVLAEASPLGEDYIRECTIADLMGEANLAERIFEVVDSKKVGYYDDNYYGNGSISPIPDDIYVIYSVNDLGDYQKSYGTKAVLVDFYNPARSIKGARMGTQRIRELKAGSEKAKQIIASLSLMHEVRKYSHRHHDLVGADPEIFAVDAEGKLIPSFDFLPGKDNVLRHPGHENSTYGAYWDGYQAEFSLAPVTCLDQLICAFKRELWTINNALQAKHPGAKLSMKNTFLIPPDRIENDAEEFVAFGCSPSLNAYGEKLSPVQGDPRAVPFRTAGGHMHFTYNGTKEQVRDAVKELDRILGVISVAMARYWDTPQRRVLYGRAGEYRTPKYGFEYRVLSNFWLCHPTVSYLVYEIARMVNGWSQTTREPWGKWDVTEEEARTCIDTANADMAVELLKRNEDSLTILLMAMKPMEVSNTQNKEAAAVWKKIIMEGAHTVVKDPDHVSDAWFIGADQREVYGFGPKAWWRLKNQLKQLPEKGLLDA